MKTIFRTQNLFATVITKAITAGQTAKNNQATFNDVASCVLENVLKNLAKEETKSIGYAGFKVFPTLSIKPVGNAQSVLDLFIHAFSRIITNDVLLFLGADKTSLVEELATLNTSEFSVVYKRKKK